MDSWIKKYNNRLYCLWKHICWHLYLSFFPLLVMFLEESYMVEYSVTRRLKYPNGKWISVTASHMVIDIVRLCLHMPPNSAITALQIGPFHQWSSFSLCLKKKKKSESSFCWQGAWNVSDATAVREITCIFWPSKLGSTGFVILKPGN